MNTETKPKFKLGQIVATPGALEAFERNNTSGREYLKRHVNGDWGMVCDEDGHLNDMAIEDGSRILSAYHLPDETKIWIITDAEIDEEHNRQATTFLLPEEY
mgnify:CR=1 FL=1